MYAAPNTCVLIDHLERFFLCLLHIGGKTGAEIVLRRFEQHFRA